MVVSGKAEVLRISELTPEDIDQIFAKKIDAIAIFSWQFAGKFKPVFWASKTLRQFDAIESKTGNISPNINMILVPKV